MAALALLGMAHASQALAQARPDVAIVSPAIPPDPRPAPVIRGGQDLPLAPVDAPSGAIVLPSNAASTRANGAASSAIDAGIDDRSGAVRSGARQDGDLTPNIARQPQDGIITVGEPQGLLDGGDPTRVEGRAEQDIAAFNTPPAGYDPSAFNIELSPMRDRRPGRLFRFAPYQPIGIRVGSFVLFPEIEAAGALTNNIFSSPNPSSDSALELAPSLRLVSNWRVHALELNARARTSFHRNFKTEDDRNYTLEARGRLDITRRSSIESLISQDITQETRGSANTLSGAGQDRADITTRTAALTGNHRFNRLSVQLRGAVAQIDYGATQVNIAAPAAPPVFASVDDRDYTARDLGMRASWEFKPTLIAFADVQLKDRTYRRLQGGVNRDSSGDEGRLGVSFGNSGAYLRGEISVGYGRRRPDQATLTPVDAFLFDANLAWRANALTSLLFAANTDFTETTLANSSAGLTRTAGISVRHAFRRNLIGTAGVSHNRVNYKGAGVTEDTTTGRLSLDYSLNRQVVLFGNYAHVAFRSNQPGSAYQTDDFRIGVRLRK